MSESERLRPLERDVLLAASGELPPWRAWTLRWRLARDPEARRLAETVALAELTLAPRPAEAVAPRAPLFFSAAAVALALVLVFALRPTGGAGQRDAGLETAEVHAPPQPAFTQLRHLRRNLRDGPPTPAAFGAQRSRGARPVRAGSPLLPRVSYLDLERPRLRAAREHEDTDGD